VRVGTLHVGHKPHHHAALDGLICVNSAQQGPAFAGRGEVIVIHNWAPERTGLMGWRDLRDELGLSADQYLIGSVGRLHPSKGMDLLVQSFMAAAPANAALAILGEGPEASRLKQLAGSDPRVHLLGFRRDVDAMLQSMDLFVSASREEAFPLALLEAMRAGLPIISTRTQGPVEMLAGQPATLVPIDDMDALSAAIKVEAAKHATTPAVSRRCSYNLDVYDRTRAVARVEEFYQILLAKSPVSLAGVGRQSQVTADLGGSGEPSHQRL
jgi:glycosyltransferase involved in cell wall biosynthesis